MQKTIFDNIEIAIGDIEGETGATFIKFDEKKKARCFRDVRGGWAGYVSSLSNMTKNVIDGIFVGGGSNLGFEAYAGVMSAAWLETRRILELEGACIFSHNLESPCDDGLLYPTKELGQQLWHTKSPFLPKVQGQVGAGTKARYGQAILQRQIYEYDFLCCIVNNAVGDIVTNDNEKGKESVTKKTKHHSTERRCTTITVLITNMQLDYFELQQLGIQMHASMAKTIQPFNSFEDGDVFYMCSTQTKRKPKWDGNDLTEFYGKVEDFIEETIKETNR